MNDIWQELEQKNNQLDTALKTLRKNRIALAEAERDYKEAVTKEVLRLRDGGMAVTMIGMVVYGLDNIKELRFKRDCAEAVWEANEEAINVFKLQLRLIEGQLNREWSNIK